MNNDLISREALKKLLEEDLQSGGTKTDEFDKGYDLGIEKAIETIDNAPTVCGNNPKWCENCVSKGKCASTRPHGKWLIEGGTTFHFCCSECGCAGDNWDKFCKHCGAKMDKEANNDD